MAYVSCGGTVLHLLARVTMASASIAPNPNLCETLSPAPLVCQSPLTRRDVSEVYAIKYCMSRHVRRGLREGGARGVCVCV